MNRFECGGLRLDGVLASLMGESDFANLRRLFGSIDGILGMEAVRDVVLEVDFPRKQVSASRHGSPRFPADTAVSYSGTLPEVMVNVGGKAVLAKIDTGFNGVLQIPDLGAVPLVFPPLKTDDPTAVAEATWLRKEISQLAGDARLGPATWRHPPLQQGKGLIGTGALNPWKLAFDQYARRIYFIGGDITFDWPPGQPRELRFRMGVATSIEGAGLRLREVDAGGACDRAGLRAGDLILTIDGKPASGFLTVAMPAEPERQNVRRELRVKREDKEFEVVLILGPDESEK